MCVGTPTDKTATANVGRIMSLNRNLLNVDRIITRLNPLLSDLPRIRAYSNGSWRKDAIPKRIGITPLTPTSTK